jgi:hypothetical protein
MRDGYRGRGDYIKAARTGLRLGRAAIAAFRAGRNSWRGTGDYAPGGEVMENAPVTTYGGAVDNQLISGGNPPISVNTSGDLTGDICFNHTEFLANVVVAGPTFANTSYAVNPGLQDSFPFLSQIARNFTLYEFEGLIFEFKPTSGEFGSGSNMLGKVIMATNYDPDAVPFTNSRDMENYDYAISNKPSLTARHGVETAPQQQALRMQYIRTGATSRDKIFTDLGLFQIATEGIPFAGNVGELWVTYKVRLSRSLINTNPELSPALYNALFTNVTPVLPLNGGTTLNNTIGVFPVASNLVFPASSAGKRYLIYYCIACQNGSSSGFNAPIQTGTTLSVFLINYGGYDIDTRNFGDVGVVGLGVESKQCTMSYFTCDDPAGVYTWSPSIAFAGDTTNEVQVIVTEVPLMPVL